MADEANQQTADTSAELSIDEVNEPTSEPTGEEETADESTTPGTDKDAENKTPEAKPEDSPAEPFLTIKYNGAEENLSRDDAITLAQKGRNYDKVYGKLQEVQNSPALKAIEAQAQRAGLSVDDYVEQLNHFQEQSDIQKIAEAYKQRFPESTDEAALSYAQVAYRNAVSQREAQQRNVEEQSSQQEQTAIASEIDAFTKEYPDVDIEKLPVEVIEDINNGEKLMSAYRAYENRQLKSELEALRKNDANKKKATGSVKDNSGAGESKDSFLKGLFE